MWSFVRSQVSIHTGAVALGHPKLFIATRPEDWLSRYLLLKSRIAAVLALLQEVVEQALGQHGGLDVVDERPLRHERAILDFHHSELKVSQLHFRNCKS
jgi:hypothetical protein